MNSKTYWILNERKNCKKGKKILEKWRIEQWKWIKNEEKEIEWRKNSGTNREKKKVKHSELRETR